MTDTSLTYEIIERLFQTAVCLTYNPLEPRSAWQYGKELQRDFEKEHHLKNTLICSKTAKLPQKTYHPDFHYFSDGTLIHCYEPWPEDAKKLEQILTALKIRGLPVKKSMHRKNQSNILLIPIFCAIFPNSRWSNIRTKKIYILSHYQAKKTLCVPALQTAIFC